MPLGGYDQDPTAENLALRARQVGQPGLGMAAPQPQAPLINPRENPLGAAGLVLGDVAAGLRGQPLRSDRLVQQKLQERQQQTEEQQLRARSAELALTTIERYLPVLARTDEKDRPAVIAHAAKIMNPAMIDIDVGPLLTAFSNADVESNKQTIAALAVMKPSAETLAYWTKNPAAAKKALDAYNEHQLTTDTKAPEQTAAAKDAENLGYVKGTKEYNDYIRERTLPKPSSTTVNLPPQQGAFEKGRGESESKQLDTTTGKAAAARQRISALDVLDASLKKAPFHGPVADILTNATMLGREMGLNMADTKDAEIANSISNQLTMALRNPASGGGLPGAVSDADRNFLRASVPSLLNSKEGGPELVKIMKKLAQRDIEEAKLASEYADKHGKFDAAGFQTTLDKFANEHPLFAEKPSGAKPNGGGKLTPAEQQEYDALKKRFGG